MQILFAELNLNSVIFQLIEHDFICICANET